MRATQLFLLLACIITPVLLESCATTATTARIPTLSFTQYGLEPGPSQNQTKSDIDITVKTIRISDTYDYPDLFSFNLEDFPQWKDNYYLKNNFPEGPLGKRWSYPFASPDASEQLLINWVKIKNGTKHILRMKDARIYMVIEGQEPIAPLSTLDEMIREGERFEAMARQQWDSQVSEMILTLGDMSYPTGITRALINRKRSSYKLINDISKEILPGFTYEGMLVFPVVPSAYGAAKISFFDVTTKTDAAGNPVEKTQFDFSLQPQMVQMWYDKTERKWKTGAPPAQTTK
jgi:hypothetical protein